MKTIRLNTKLVDGNYMDIESIDFVYDVVMFGKQVRDCCEILEQNPFLKSVNISLIGNQSIKTTNTYVSKVEESCNSTETSFRIDTEYITVSYIGSETYITYVGQSKWTGDYLEVNLNSLL